MAERTIVLDGFSKTFAMTGWRLGYAIVPPSLVAMYGQLVINTISCAPTFAQIGAVEAIRGPQEPMAAMVEEFRARRDLVVDGLNAIPGIRCLSPKGAFYAFPDIGGTGLERQGAGRPAAARGRRLRPGRDGVRRHRDEPHPGLVRELAREPDEGARADRRVRGGAAGGRGAAPRRRRPMSAIGRRSSSSRLIPDEGIARDHRGLRRRGLGGRAAAAAGGAARRRRAAATAS